MKVYQENRKKIIFKNCVTFLIVSVIVLPILNNYFSIHKSKTELITLFIFSCVGLILSTKKIKLEFDDKSKILTISDSHILGGGTKYTIPYENMQFSISQKKILSKILNKPKLTILNNGSRITEINNLRNINKSNELIVLLNNITKKN